MEDGCVRSTSLILFCISYHEFLFLFLFHCVCCSVCLNLDKNWTFLDRAIIGATQIRSHSLHLWQLGSSLVQGSDWTIASLKEPGWLLIKCYWIKLHFLYQFVYWKGGFTDCTITVYRWPSSEMPVAKKEENTFLLPLLLPLLLHQILIAPKTLPQIPTLIHQQ